VWFWSGALACMVHSLVDYVIHNYITTYLCTKYEGSRRKLTDKSRYLGTSYSTLSRNIYCKYILYWNPSNFYLIDAQLPFVRLCRLFLFSDLYILSYLYFYFNGYAAAELGRWRPLYGPFPMGFWYTRERDPEVIRDKPINTLWY